MKYYLLHIKMQLKDDEKLLIKYVNEDDYDNFINILNKISLFSKILRKENLYLFNNSKKIYINYLRGIYHYTSGNSYKSTMLLKKYINININFNLLCEIYYSLKKYNKSIYYLYFLINRDIKFLLRNYYIFNELNKLNKYFIYLFKYKYYWTGLLDKRHLIYIILKK